MSWWLLASLALAQNADESRAVAPCPLEVQRYLEAVQQDGVEEAYLCLIETDAFKAPLVAKIREFPPDSEEDNRLTRALALHLAARADQPFDPAEVTLLNPADRRLLADAIKARRGRHSPSAEHEAIFQKQPWYNPRERFTNNMLSDVEKENVSIANNPKKALAAMGEAPPEDAPPAQPPTGGPPPSGQPAGGPPPGGQPPAEAGCGCSGVGGLPLGLVLLAPLWWRRRATR